MTPDNNKKAKFLDIKGNFSPIRRSRPYVPTPHHLYLGNFSSVNYNIISNENNEKRFNSPKSMIDKSKTRMYFRKIGLSKYSDLERPINKHFNKEYKEEIIQKILGYLEFIAEYFLLCMIMQSEMEIFILLLKLN